MSLRCWISPGESVTVSPEGRWTCEWLGLSGDPQYDRSFRGLALRTGMASQVPHGPAARLAALAVSPTRARTLPQSVAAAVAASIGHNLRGTLSYWTVTVCATMYGAAARDPLTLGIGLIGALFLLSVLLHEAGHVLVFRLLAPAGAQAHIVSHGLHCYMVRLALPRRKDLAVALAGPFGPLLLGGPVLLALLRWPPTQLLWAAAALGHIATLLLPVGDGLALRRHRAEAEPGSG
ncbi:hypothetical protein [Actinomyces trachealis]|uniref:hypothetical protein n=1 Tax=Actinomyces trachealis TaxID=2763540 RepID=UPI001892CFE7|nr:hypothetical protein [Actinomyces trachealis]